MSNFGFTVDANEEIDYNFFDDSDHEKSEINNNVMVDSNKTELNRNVIDSSKNSSHKSDRHNSCNVGVSSSDDLEELSIKSSDSASSKQSSLSNSKSVHSSHQNGKSLHVKNSFSRELSSSQRSSAHDSASESDVTTISSLDSEPRRSTTLGNKSKSNSNSRQSQVKNITYTDNTDDIDRIQPEAILRAMIRIHEERRALRHLRPKWVDPNSKDYSVSGLTAKMKLVPERIVSAQKKNIRDNPFYLHFNKNSGRPYHAALNREKELDRIEKENRAIYERIKKVQPSPGITKQELLREYSKTNRFAFPHKFSPYAGSSYRALSGINGRSSSQARRTHSSASVQNHKSDPDETLVSRKFGDGKVRSASSLTSVRTKSNSAMSDQRRSFKKSRY